MSAAGNRLVVVLARIIARRLERGSRKGAIIGGAVGIPIGAAATYGAIWVLQSNSWHIVVPLACVAGFVGAMIGAGPGNPNVPVVPDESVPANESMDQESQPAIQLSLRDRIIARMKRILLMMVAGGVGGASIGLIMGMSIASSVPSAKTSPAVFMPLLFGFIGFLFGAAAGFSNKKDI